MAVKRFYFITAPRARVRHMSKLKIEGSPMYCGRFVGLTGWRWNTRAQALPVCKGCIKGMHTS